MFKNDDARADGDAEHYLALALEASGIGIWRHHPKTNSIIWDNRLREIYGIGPAESPQWVERLHPDDRAYALQEFERALLECSGYQSRFRIVRPDGSVRFINSKAHYHQGSDGDPYLIGAEWDVTEDVEREERLRQRTNELEELRRSAEMAALQDHLTGLPNRRALDQFLKQDILPRPDAIRAAICVDLDHFKTINDRYGHEAGDKLLKLFARGLSDLMPHDGFASRLGGDEFIVLLPSAVLQSVDLLSATIVSMARTLSEHLGHDDASASVGASIGREKWSEHIDSADRALYAAKWGGRSRHVIYCLDGRSETQKVNT